VHPVQAQHRAALQERQVALPVPIPVHGSHLWAAHHRIMQAPAGAGGAGHPARPAVPADAGLPQGPRLPAGPQALRSRAARAPAQVLVF